MEQRRYQCDSCGYEFKARYMPKRCPYCASEKVHPQKTAEELLEEASEEA